MFPVVVWHDEEEGVHGRAGAVAPNGNEAHMKKPPKNLRPYHMEFLLRDDVNPERQMSVAYERMRNLSQCVQGMVKQCAQEESDFTPDELNGFTNVDKKQAELLFVTWIKHMVLYHEQFREIRSLERNEKRHNMATNVVVELSKLYAILHRSEVMMDGHHKRGRLYYTLQRDTRHSQWVRAFASFNIEYKEKELPDDMLEQLKEQVQNKLWSTPLYELTQTQLSIMLMMLSQMVNDITDADIMREYQIVFHVVWLRFAVLITRLQPIHVLDDPEYRKPVVGQEWFTATLSWYVMCCTYIAELLRRFYHWELIKDVRILKRGEVPPVARVVPPPRLQVVSVASIANRVRFWIMNAICNELIPMETMEEAYTNGALESGFNLPGDNTWFKYIRPDDVLTRGDVLANLRPHLYRRYTVEQVQPRVIAQMHKESHVSRLFILLCFSEMIAMDFSGINWFDTVVIDNDGIEMSARARLLNVAPFLMQVFSSYWVYYRSHVYTTDDIFEAIAVWCLLLRDEYDGMFLGHTNMKPFLTRVLEQDDPAIERSIAIAIASEMAPVAAAAEVAAAVAPLPPAQPAAPSFADLTNVNEAIEFDF